MQRIAIIGAGAAGLCAARHLVKSGNIEAVVYESSNHIGGTWFYSDETHQDQYGLPIHSSMYKNLRTNLPKQTMAFPDLAFDADLPSFLTHEDMLRYLGQYCEEFSLERLIQFNTLVEDAEVRLENDSDHPKWKLRLLDLQDNKHDEQTFDGLIVCNGHYFVPNVPEIEGRDIFQGNVIHSHHYRTPDQYAGLNVVLLGAKSSGVDIALDISKVAESVVLSHRYPELKSALPENVRQNVVVTRFTKNGVIFEDDTSAPCDVLIFCTGYKYSFPFFKSQDIVQVHDNRITPLYKHLVHVKYPNLFFIGLGLRICPFPQFHCQMLYVMALLTNRAKLPTEEEMLLDEEKDYRERLSKGYPHRSAHLLGPIQWKYNDDLADMADEARISDNARLAYELCHTRRVANVQLYKEDHYVLGTNGRYHVVSK